MPNFEDKAEFIKRHRREMAPIIDDTDERGTFVSIQEAEDIRNLHVDPARIEKILERFETKVYAWENTSPTQDAKSVLIEASETLAFRNVVPILDRLTHDPRCRAICFITDSIAGREFEKKGDRSFVRISHDHSKPLLAELPANFDVALAMVEQPNSPNALLLYGAKSIFGAKKLFLLVTGWQGVGGTNLFREDAKRRTSTMESIDGVFCNDELAKIILKKDMPNFPDSRVYAIGTLTLGTLEVERGEEYKKEGRRKLGIRDSAFALLYAGQNQSVCSEAYGSRKDIEEETLRRTFDVVMEMARSRPKEYFALLLRPHPSDAEQKRIYDIARLVSLADVPKNLEIRLALAVSMQEAVYAADIISSISSNEVFLAHYRGKKGVFLGFAGDGLGADLLRKIYGSEELVAEIKDSRILEIVNSSEELLGLLSREHQRIPQKPAPIDKEDIIKKTLDSMFADS